MKNKKSKWKRENEKIIERTNKKSKDKEINRIKKEERRKKSRKKSNLIRRRKRNWKIQNWKPNPNVRMKK